MNSIIENIITIFTKNGSPDSLIYKSLLNKIDFKIDKDYLDFISVYDGATGKIGENGYVLLWSINDLISLNPYYEDVEECKSLFFFGSDGANLGYAFDKRNGTIVAIDFLDISYREPQKIGDSFESFLKEISNK